jgi:cytoskeletal protein CcmA (bactofilin family)
MAYASVIGSSAVIRGNVRGDSSLEILGRIEGDVGVTGDLALGPDAVVVGAVSGARISISGSVEGDVTATEAVVIAETGRVVGDLSAPRIGMSEGALLRGSVRTDGFSGGGRPAARSEARAASAPAERPAPRPAASPAPAAAAASAPKPVAKKAPPPPVIQAPRAGARARKRMLKR